MFKGLDQRYVSGSLPSARGMRGRHALFLWGTGKHELVFRFPFMDHPIVFFQVLAFQVYQVFPFLEQEDREWVCLYASENSYSF